MAGEKGATTHRVLNQLQYAVANVASDLSTGIASNDVVMVFDVSADYEPKFITPSNMNIGVGSGRIVTTTSTSLALTATQHAEKVVVVNTNSTVANTFTLPVATGSGACYTVVNGIAQTQGSVVVAANGTDIIKGRCLSFDTTAVATAATHFVTTATSDKVTFNRSTTGGSVGYDTVIAYDMAANTWLVDVSVSCTGAKATPFSET